MPDINEYKIVPVEATGEMRNDGCAELILQSQRPMTDPAAVFEAMLEVSPPPGEDLVERVADIVQNCHRHNGPLETARAILAEIGRKG